MNNKDRKECYICHKEIKDNNKSINLTYETGDGEIRDTYYVCSRDCFLKLADHLKEVEPYPLYLNRV